MFILIHFIINLILLMKRFLLYVFLGLTSLSINAELNGDGYYRVKNAVTKRHAYLLDNKASKNVGASTVDVTAIELYLDEERPFSDPATVIYLTNVPSSSSQSFYDIAGQGTSLYTMLSMYMKVIKGKVYEGEQAYYAYGSKDGLTKYLGDRNASLSDYDGFASVDVSGDRRLWYINPVDANSDKNYFGVSPTVSVNGKHYQPFFAGFPFSFNSQGMKAYVITQIDGKHGIVVYKEVKGTIPSGTPVIIECSNDKASSNRLNIGPSGDAANVSGNLLKGVYFDNPDKIHFNRKGYNKTTMRSLAAKDGKLVFTVGNYDYVPRNQAYLQLTDASQYNTADYVLMTQEEYETYLKNLVVEVSGISISKTELNLTEGDKASLTATITPQDATDKTVTWTSSNESIATVSASGEVTAVKAGSATITASSSNGKTAVCKVNVNPLIIQVSSIVLDRDNAVLKVGESVSLTASIVPVNATDKTIIWSSDNESVATVDNNGTVTAITIGSATITASSSNGKTAVCKVTVASNIILVSSIVLDKENAELKVGESITLYATVGPDDATDKTVIWTSDDESVATVDKNGTVTAISVGKALVTASSGNVSASCTVNVNPILAESLVISPEIWSGNEGSSFVITATILPEAATDKSLNWESSDVNIASVDGEGNVAVLKEGRCVITVSTRDGSNLKAECVITSQSGVDEIMTEPDSTVDVYTVNGLLLKKDCNRESLNSLPKGIYILRLQNGNASVLYLR